MNSPINMTSADALFSDIQLTQVDADEAALNWMKDFKRPDTAYPSPETAQSQRGEIRANLQRYKDWNVANGSKPFAAKKEAKAKIRAAKLEENLPKWGELFSDDGFDGAIEGLGMKDQYERILKSGGDPAYVRDQFRKNIFLKQFAGRRDDVAQANITKNLLESDDMSDEGFVAGVRQWVGGELNKKQIRNDAYEAGAEFFLFGNNDDFRSELAAQKEIGPEAAESFLKAQTVMRREFGGVVPAAQSVVERAKSEGDRRLFEDKEHVDVNWRQIITFYQTGQREKFLHAVGKIAEKEGVLVDGAFTRGIKNGGNVIDGIREGLERFIDTARVTIKETDGGFDKDELERERLAIQVRSDLANLPETVASLKSQGAWETMFQGTVSTLAYGGVAAIGWAGLGAIASSQGQEMKERMQRDNPDLSDQEAYAVSLPAGAAYAGIERLQLMGFFGKFPGVQKLVDRVSKGGLFRRIGSTLAFEYAQETVQEGIEPMARDIGTLLNEEMPYGEWENFKVIDTDRALAILPLSVLSGGGQFARDKFTVPELREILTDKRQLRISGRTEAESDEVIAKAEVNPDAALRLFRDQEANLSKEERNKIGDAAMAEIYREELGDDFSEMPIVRPDGDGKFVVDYRDGRKETVASQAEAQVMIEESFREDFLNTSEAMKAFAAELDERSEGDNEVKIAKPRTFQDLANAGRGTEAELKKAVQVYYAQMGQVAPDKIDLANYTEQGSVRLRNRLGDYAVRLAKGANPFDVSEEFSEGFIRRAVQQGETTFDEVKTLLDEFGEMSGLEMTQGFDVDTDRAVIEGFSKFVKAYALQGKYDSMPKETQGWMKKAWRIMENPDSLPAPLRAMAELFAKLYKVVHDVAKAIEFHKTDGNGLDADLESLAQRALGLDEKAYSERMEEQYRRELMEDIYDPAEELSAQVKGKLPRPKDPAANGYEGELSAIFDRFKKLSTRKDGSKKESTIAATKLFAKKGEGIPLDQLRADLNEEGFQFETANDLLDAIEESQRGNKQWPVAMGETAGSSFSISRRDAEFDFLAEVEAATQDWSELQEAWETAESFERMMDEVADEMAAEGVNFDDEMAAEELERRQGELDRDSSREGIEKKLLDAYYKAENGFEAGLKKFVEPLGYEFESGGGNFQSFYFYVSPEFETQESFEEGDPDGWAEVEEFTQWKIRFSDHANTSSLHESPDVNVQPGDDISTEFSKFLELLPDLKKDRQSTGLADYPANEVSVPGEKAAGEGDQDRSSGARSFSITAAQDAAYLKAVESGDMEAVREMVEKNSGPLTINLSPGEIEIADWMLGGPMSDVESMEEVLDRDLTESDLPFLENDLLRFSSADFLRDAFYRVDTQIEDMIFDSLNEVGGTSKNEAGKIRRAARSLAKKLKAKIPEPVAYDANGKVIPLSERFDEGDDRITFSITPTAQRESTLEAIDRLFAGPSGMVETGRKLRKKLGDIRERYESNMFGKQFADVDNRELETLNALLQLNAIASVLPSEVRSVVGSPVSLVSLKSEKAREKNVIQRLDKISRALDKHLQKELRESIRKELNKSGFKLSDSRRRKGKIGKIGHEVVDQVRQVMTMDLESAEAEKNRLLKEFDDIETPLGEDFERWDSRSMATDLFYDYENAPTTRLEQAHEFITTNYKEGRKEWLAVLKGRKEERDQWVAEAISFMGDADRVYLEDLTKAENEAKGAKKSFSEAGAEFLFSNHHTLARIVENAKDKDKAREWYNRLLDSRIQGDIKSEREADEKQQAFFDEVARVIGASGAKKGHDVRKFLYEAKRTRKNEITTLEGESISKVSIDKHLVESILNGEVAGIDGEIYSAADIEALTRQWEKFENLTEKEQNQVRKIKFERIEATGERRPVGELSQAEVLQWWLTMRQPDQREKLEAMGWDERTMEEMDGFLTEEVKQVGLWMSKDLVKDGKTLSDIHADEFGIGLNTGENYFPVKNRIVDQPIQMDMNDPGAGRNISPGSLKERVVNRARPAQANAFGTYFQHITEMAYWKHNVGWVRQYGGAMRTKAFSENMEAKVGKHAAKHLQSYLASVQNRGVNAGREMMAMERFLKSLLSRTSLAILGARVSTMWINATAFVNALASPDVSATAVMKNMIKIGISPKGDLRATWRNELAVMRRRYGASFEAQMAMKSGNAGHWLIQDAEKLAQKGLIPMNVIDVAANTLTMAAIYRTHYDAAIKRGESQVEAHEFADAGVTRAHATLAQPTLSVSRSQAEMKTMSNPFMGFLTMFMSEVRKNAANNFVAWRTAFTGKGIVNRSTAVRQAAVYTLVYPAVVQAVRGLYNSLTGDDAEDEEIEAQLKDPKFWAYAIASDNLSPVPILGDAALGLLAEPLEQKYWEQRSPIARVVGQWKQTERIFDEKNSDSERIDEVIDQMQSWGAVMPGGPVFAQAANVGDFAKDVFENGMGKTFSEADQVKKNVREILQNKEAIFERTEDKEERIDLLVDVIEQYRDERPEMWEALEKGLRQTKDGAEVMGANGKPLYKVSREVMEKLSETQDR